MTQQQLTKEQLQDIFNFDDSELKIHCTDNACYLNEFTSILP